MDARGEHRGDLGAHRQPHALEVDSQDVIEGVLGNVGQRLTAALGAAGVVERAVKAALARDRRVDKPLGGVGGGNVAGIVPVAAKLVTELREALLGAGAEHDAGARGRTGEPRRRRCRYWPR